MRALILIITSFLYAVSSYPQTLSTNKTIHWNKHRGYQPFKNATSEDIHMHNQCSDTLYDCINFEDTLAHFSITFRASNLTCNPGKNFKYTAYNGETRHRQNPEWGLILQSSRGDSLIMEVKTEEVADKFSSHSAVRVDIYHKGFSEKFYIEPISEGINCFSGPNCWEIGISPKDITLSAGNRGLNTICRIPNPFESYTAFGFIASPAAEISITDITLHDLSSPAMTPHPRWENAEAISSYLSYSKDPIEGYWTIFDRTLDESLLQTGGEYKLAIIREGDKYLILYLDGARTNARAWKQGMLKGKLIPDPFPKTYSLTWYDSEGNPLSKDIKAQQEEEDILSIQFPYQSSTMRLRRLPK